MLGAAFGNNLPADVADFFAHGRFIAHHRVQIAQHGLQSIGERLRLLLGQGLQADLNQRFFILVAVFATQPLLDFALLVALGGDHRVHNPIEMAIVVVDIQNGGINQKRHVVGNDFNHHIAGRKSRFGVLLQAAQTRLAALSRLASKVIMAQRACQKLRQGIMV